MRRAAALLLFTAAPAFAQTPTAVIGTNFTGSNQGQSGYNPPDTQGAVGMNHYVEHDNGVTAVYTKNGTLVERVSLDSFWVRNGGPTIAGASFDPRVIFDRASGRWFVSANDGLGSQPNSGFLLAVSNTADPTAGYSRFRFDADADNTNWSDFNMLGVGPTWVTVSNNMFPISGLGGSFNVSFLTVPKASLLAGNIAGSQYLNDQSSGTFGGSVHPAVDAAPAGATQYQLSPYISTNLRLSKVTGAAATPTFSAGNFLTTPIQNDPPDAPQSGSTTLLATNDARFGSPPVLVNGKLWAVRTVSNGGIAQIAWYRINPTGGTGGNGAIEAQGILPTPAGLYVFFPAVAVNPAGDIVVGFSGSNANQFGSTYYLPGRYDGTNTQWGNAVLAKAGLNFNNSGRYGDYSAASVDPSDPGQFSIAQEFINASSQWAVQHTEVIPNRAGEVRWKDPLAGAFEAPGSWAAGAAPAAADHVIFSRWSNTNYAVTVPAAGGTADRVSVRQTGIATGTTPSVLTLNLAGNAPLTLNNPLAATPSLTVAEFLGTASVAVTGQGTLTTKHTSLAAGANSVGTLAVAAAANNSLTWDNLNDVAVGGSASASGGRGTLTVGSTTGGSTSVAVGGTLTLWNNASSLAVSGGGNGAAGHLAVAALTNPAGTAPAVTVANPGGRLRVLGAAAVPFTGTVAVSNGGTLDGTGTLAGPVTVVNGTVRGGTGNPGETLTLTGGLTFDIAAAVPVAFADANPGNGTADPVSSRIDLGSAVFARDVFLPSADVMTFTISGSQYDYGVSYTITVLTFGSSSGVNLADLSVNPVPVGFAFAEAPSIALTATSVQITFTPVPEPAWLLAAAGPALLAARRRRPAA